MEVGIIEHRMSDDLISNECMTIIPHNSQDENMLLHVVL
jgi:hypothetical protein